MNRSFRGNLPGTSRLSLGFPGFRERPVCPWVLSLGFCPWVSRRYVSGMCCCCEGGSSDFGRQRPVDSRRVQENADCRACGVPERELSLDGGASRAAYFCRPCPHERGCPSKARLGGRERDSRDSVSGSSRLSPGFPGFPPGVPGSPNVSPFSGDAGRQSYAVPLISA